MYHYDDNETHNNHSGNSDNVIQARDIHGDINYYERDHGVFYYQIFRHAGTALFLTLFTVSTSYSYYFNGLGLRWWEWIILVPVTAALIKVFLHTHSWIYPNPSFRSLRTLLAVGMIALGYNYGAEMSLISDVASVLAHWLVLRF